MDSLASQEWTGLSKSSADSDCATQVGFGYRELTNGCLIEYLYILIYIYKYILLMTRMILIQQLTDAGRRGIKQ